MISPTKVVAFVSAVLVTTLLIAVLLDNAKNETVVSYDVTPVTKLK